MVSIFCFAMLLWAELYLHVKKKLSVLFIWNVVGVLEKLARFFIKIVTKEWD